MVRSGINPRKPPRGYKLVPGFTGYAVSRSGRVLSCRASGGGGPHYKEWYRLKWTLTMRAEGGRKPRGYYRVNLRHRDGVRRKTAVHHLVLLAYVGPRPPKKEACHKNGNFADNRRSNLYWGTKSDNMRDRYAHGRGLRGTMFKRSKLTDQDVRTIRASSDHYLVLARRYGVHHNTIYSVRRNDTWRHVR